MVRRIETCWACGQREEYDTDKHHRPFHWHSYPLAGGVHMLCQGCIALLNVRGRVSHILIERVRSTQGISIDERGDVRAVPADLRFETELVEEDNSSAKGRVK